MGSRKPFDTELFAANDARARAAVAACLNEQGLYCHENSDKYGPDLEVFTGYKFKYYVECEVKRVWTTGPTFPWDTIQIPERKKKFTEQPKLVEFWLLSDDLKYAVIIPEEILVGSPLVEVPNKYIAEGEKFFQVPVEQCIIRRITE